MYVMLEEFKENVEKYPLLSAHEDIYIVMEGRPVSLLSATKRTKQRVFESFAGSHKFDGDLEEFIFKSRMEDYESLD